MRILPLFSASLAIQLSTLAAGIPNWKAIESLPNKLGVAGPFAGIHNNALIVAGGANFKRPIWETDKTWYAEIHVLEKTKTGYQWHAAGKLPRKTGYGAAVSTPDGVICMGGNDGAKTFSQSYVLKWNPKAKKIIRKPFPQLPRPAAHGQAALLGNTIYFAGGQHGNPLDTAMKNFWSIDLKAEKPQWKKLKPWSGLNRAFNLTVAQNGRIYVFSGRRQQAEDVQFLKDVHEYNPQSGKWTKKIPMPFSRVAGTAIAYGDADIYVLGGADGSLWADAPKLGDKHPGFPKEAWRFDAKRNSWASAGPMPANHVTTIPVIWNNKIIVPTGEIRPRVRSPRIWEITVATE